jgi:ClpP class serine protease
MRATDYILSRPWAMVPEMIETLVAIADRVNESPELVAAKLGRPLENTQSVEMRDAVAVIPVRGPISRYASWFTEVSDATSVDVLARDFRAAIDDPGCRGVVLEIDSPGGQAAGIGEFADQIRAGSKIKPVVCYVSNFGASAAYWLASAGGSVIIAPTAIVGSIGVVQPVALNRKDEGGRRSIEFVSSQSPNKRPDPETDAGRSEIQRTVDALAQVFVEAVASYRDVDAAAVIDRFGKGGLMVGRDAVECGMADRLGSLEACIHDLNSPKKPRASRAVLYSGPPNKDQAMKLSMPRLFTAWLERGTPETLDATEFQAGAPEVDEDEIPQVITPTVESQLQNPSVEEIAAERAAMVAQRAEIRAARVETYGLQAQAFLALHAGKIAPAEHDGLKAAYVAAALIDHEAPVAGVSILGGVKSSVETRKPHGLTTEIVSGDLNVVKDHLAAHKLKVLENAAASPSEAKGQAEAARFETLMNATEEGRAILADMRSRGKSAN